MSFLSFIFKSSVTDERYILNFGLKISMAGGGDFMKPLQNKLSRKFPSLSQDKLDEYDKVCRSARDFGYELVYKNIGSVAPNGIISKKEFKEMYLKEMVSNYSWMNKSNLRSVFNLGRLWAYHDGLI